jgi:hypothetical protein
MHASNRPGILLLLFALSVLSFTQGASAQTRRTATRTDEIDAFGGFTYLDNDYRPPHPNYGVTLGADYTHFIPQFRGLITPSVQIRGTITPGSADTQKTIQVGIKLATTYRRFHPYGDFLFGNGVITFPLPPNPVPGTAYRVRDSSAVYTYGGGITYDFRPNWSAMVDYQHQYWDLGARPSPSPPDRFYPQALTFGVVFHIPLKAYKTR